MQGIACGSPTHGLPQASPPGAREKPGGQAVQAEPRELHALQFGSAEEHGVHLPPFMKNPAWQAVQTCGVPGRQGKAFNANRLTLLSLCHAGCGSESPWDCCPLPLPHRSVLAAGHAVATQHSGA